MNQQIVTELVIDSDTSGADQFSQAMDRSNASASGATSSVGSMTLAVAGVGVAIVGALAGMRSFVDFAGAQSQALVDIATHAELAGISTKEFQQDLFAARAAGITEKDFVSGLDKITADITAAGQGVTQFSKLFEANGISLKDQNGQLITTKAALADIMGLMQNASPAVQRAIASIVGVSASWIPLLKEGSDQFEAQKKAAADLGTIIEDSTIHKAAEFNSQWKTAVATWDLQFKASLASILPLLMQMATLASQILSGIGGATGYFGRLLTPDEDKTKAQLNDQINDAYRLREALAALGGDSSGGSFLGPQQRARTLAATLGLPEDASISQVDTLLDKLAALYDKKPTQLTVNATGSTVLPQNDTGGDRVDAAINSLRKHIETQLADTLAIDQGAGALARFRAQAAETSAVQANGGKETAEQAAKFAQLKDAAAAAADAFARAKIASEIRFGANTAFLSQTDVQIAAQLKTIYPDVATALNSAEAAQLRFNSAMKEVSSALENNLTSGLTDIVSGTKSVGQGFTDMGLAVVKAIEQMIIKIAIVQPLMAALQATVSGLGILGPTTVTGLGAGTGGLSFPAFAGGTDSAPGGWSIVGENGPELMRVPTGAQILPNGVGAGGGGTQVNVSVMNFGNDNVSISQKQNSNGGIDLELMVGQAAANQMAKPGSTLRQVTDNRARLATR